MWFMANQPTFGTVMRRIRLDRGLSQESLAEMLGMETNAYISRLENGKKQPSLEMVYKISRALQVPAWEIVKEIEEAEKAL